MKLRQRVRQELASEGYFLYLYLYILFSSQFCFQGYYYLFYSSGWFSEPYYNVRIAKAKSPTGPFIKKKLPILETNWELYKQVSQGLNVAMTAMTTSLAGC